MARVLTVSRVFPAYHPKKGQPTFFPEKILRSLYLLNKDTICSGINNLWDVMGYSGPHKLSAAIDDFEPKGHTIRSGKRWKDGDLASLRIWSRNPYNSPQVIITPIIQLTVKDIEIKSWNEVYINFVRVNAVQMEYLAKNDGLDYMEMVGWFNKLPFSGQILIWNNSNLPY